MEKWIHLTTDDIRQVLAEDEIEKLQSMSILPSLEDIIQEQLDSVSDAYRASFQSKGYNIDIRAHYLPNAYRMYALVLARYFICTRFPNSLNIFLDEPRKELYLTAQKLLENPYIGVPDPDYSDDPVLSGDTDLTSHVDNAITLPYQRMWTKPGCYGFLHPYFADTQYNNK